MKKTNHASIQITALKKEYEDAKSVYDNSESALVQDYAYQTMTAAQNKLNIALALAEAQSSHFPASRRRY